MPQLHRQKLLSLHKGKYVYISRALTHYSDCFEIHSTKFHMVHLLGGSWVEVF